ncbi:MAG TPA: hypothetical protein VEK07_12550 [Polyangiaceae bacterium]|nr:hypothetical protein [Polyangiaceae bacterium]
MPSDARPPFAADFPRDPELDAAVESFVNGNYAKVRADGARILASDAEESVKRAARALVERTTPAPLALALLGLTALLVAAVGGWWVLHGKAPIPPAAHATPARTPNIPRAPLIH